MSIWDFSLAAFGIALLAGIALRFTVAVAFALNLLLRAVAGRNDFVQTGNWRAHLLMTRLAPAGSLYSGWAHLRTAGAMDGIGKHRALSGRD